MVGDVEVGDVGDVEVGRCGGERCGGVGGANYPSITLLPRP